MRNEIGLVLGRKGCGKTTWIRERATHLSRIVVLDSLGDDYDGGVVFSDIPGLVEYYNRVRSAPDFSIIFKPVSDRDCDLFFRFARRAWDIRLVVDEVDRYCSPWTINEDLKWILNYGRHRAISLIGVARRAANVHRDFSAACDWMALFQTTEPRDLEYLSKLTDTAQIPGLGLGQFVMKGSSTLFNERG